MGSFPGTTNSRTCGSRGDVPAGQSFNDGAAVRYVAHWLLLNFFVQCIAVCDACFYQPENTLRHHLMVFRVNGYETLYWSAMSTPFILWLYTSTAEGFCCAATPGCRDGTVTICAEHSVLSTTTGDFFLVRHANAMKWSLRNGATSPSCSV